MCKIKTLMAVGLLASASTSVLASEWYATSVEHAEASIFFDAETVERDKNFVTVWIKKVQISKPDKQGAWANASRYRFDCKKRTIFRLTSSTYDQSGKFIKSYSSDDSPSDVVPDSVGEDLAKMVCKPKFPRDSASNDYVKLKDNDVYRATRDYVDLLNTIRDKAPQ